MAPAPDRVRNAFKEYDPRGEGMISKFKMCEVIKRLNSRIPQKDLDLLFSAADVDENGRLNYEGFVMWLWSDYATEQEAEDARTVGLWQGAMLDAREGAAVRYPADKVAQYFDAIEARLQDPMYAEHVKTQFFLETDKNHDGKVSFEEAKSLIRKSLTLAADFGAAAAKPTHDEIREAFDAHDTKAEGRGRLGVNEFLNLARYLQVRVAAAMLPFSNLMRNS